MRNAVLACAALVILLCVPGITVESSVDTFNGTYVGGPVGPIPAGWTYFGYGPPAWTEQETGLVLPPNDGSNSATRWNVPGWASSGTIALYIAGWSLDDHIVPGQPIDWAYPVYLKAEIYAADYGTNTQWRTTFDLQGYERTPAQVEWGNDGQGNAEWIAVTCPVEPGQAGKSGNLVMVLDFNFSGKSFAGTNAVIWENVRIDYTPVPEPSSLIALSAGLIGMAGFLRRRA